MGKSETWEIAQGVSWLACFTAWLGLGLAQPAWGQAGLETAVARWRQKYDVAGLAAAGIRGTNLAFTLHQGWADLDRKLPVTDETLFRVASISKVFTSVAAMQLWERGLLDLDQPVGHWLGFAVSHPVGAARPITVRQILAHNSGLRDGADYDRFLACTYTNPAVSLAEVLSPRGRFYGPSLFTTNPPGTQYEYSNLGFVVLGTVVEKITGERFEARCQAGILDPLGLKATFNTDRLGPEDWNRLAVLYRWEQGRWQPQAENWRGQRPPSRIQAGYRPGDNAIYSGPQGGLRATARDLARFLIWFRDPASHPGILKPETARLMRAEAGPGADPTNDQRGLGLHRTRNLVPGQTWIGHNGEAYGLLSGMYFQEEGPYGMVFIMNGCRPGRDEQGFYPVEKELAGLLLEHLRK